MKSSKWMQLGFATIALLSLVACSTGQKKQLHPGDVDQANAAYQDGAEANGAGEESSFGEEGGKRSENGLSKKVYHFDFDSNIVREEDKPAILANAEYLVSHPRTKVILEGHTDPRGSREYNIGLGERRAKAVADILTERGVSPSQIRLVSYGSEKLAASGHNEEAYAENRRVVLAHYEG